MPASLYAASTVCAGQAIRPCLTPALVGCWVEGFYPLTAAPRHTSITSDSLSGAYDCLPGMSHTVSWAVPTECMCVAMLCVHGWLLQPCWACCL
jgi:hypothetical protein